MDDLPQHLILEILSRLNDSSDLARCRVTCKTLNSLSYQVNSINLHCSFDQYLRSRSTKNHSKVNPFKSIFLKFISKLPNIESVTIVVGKPTREISYDDLEDESDDLYLTDVDFVSRWLPCVSKKLRELSVSDFWIQSCWRRSDLLALVSRQCPRLQKLVVKNAWLSVDRLMHMISLTSLTLEYIRLDDDDLSRLNTCFPCLQVLNLIGVGGLKDPKIHLQHLTACHWIVSNAPLTLSIIAPKLRRLKLKSVRPKSLVLEAPLLSDFHLCLEKSILVCIEELLHLGSFYLESADLNNLICTFCFCKAARNVSLDAPNSLELIGVTNFSLDAVFDAFPNMRSLTLGPGAYSQLENSFLHSGLKGRPGMKELKEFRAHVVVFDVDFTFFLISSILDRCCNLSDVALLIHGDVDSVIAGELVSKCMACCPRVRWKWGMWKEGSSDDWVSYDWVYDNFRLRAPMLDLGQTS